MNQPKNALENSLYALLKQASSLSAAQMQAATGKSQASISLALKKLGPQIHRQGAARSTRYALTQDILGLPASHDLLHYSAKNGVQDGIKRFGRLTFLQDNRVHVQSGQHAWQAQGQLPWFLTPLKPQGFMGRELARVRPDFSPNPDDWTLAQVLYMATNHVTDPIGAFFIRPAVDLVAAVSSDELEKAIAYEHRVIATSASLPAGSSAAGEQPKFTARQKDGERYIVKFSPPRGTPFGERWHQLLHLEQRALQTLAANGIASAQTQVLQTAKRTFLQSHRFDRSSKNAMRHMVAASAVHDEFVRGSRVNWLATCNALVAQKRLSSADAKKVSLSYLFGLFIGNTDMHFGNLSFFVDDVVSPVLIPTPVYDMLPMMWRPDIHSGNLDPSPLREPVLPAGYAEEAVLARAWARDYWQQASNDAELSAEFRALCLENARRLHDGFE